MFYYNHNNEVEEIGADEHEAIDTLMIKHGLDFEEIVRLLLDDYIYEK